MTLAPRTRNLALTIHLTVSVGWVGAAMAYLALARAAAHSRDASLIRSSWVAMELIGWAVLVPLAVGTVVTGLLVSLGTKWGLFRHYWVLISFTLTSLAAAILILHMPDVSTRAAEAQRADASELEAIGSDLLHSSFGLVVLLLVLVLNVFKPRGLTRFGWRRQQRERQPVGPRSA